MIFTMTYLNVFFYFRKHKYTHYAVNHSLHFKDPKTGVHTNEIDSLWRHAKINCPAFNRKRNHFEGKFLKINLYYSHVNNSF